MKRRCVLCSLAFWWRPPFCIAWKRLLWPRIRAGRQVKRKFHANGRAFGLGTGESIGYFLWSSIPDVELSRAAEAGELENPEELSRQARRMLADPKARRFATEFFGQWFGFYRFDGYRGVDTARFKEFSDNLKSAMYNEAVSFSSASGKTGHPGDTLCGLFFSKPRFGGALRDRDNGDLGDECFGANRRGEQIPS